MLLIKYHQRRKVTKYFNVGFFNGENKLLIFALMQRMRKILAVALIGLYLVLNLGVNLSAHFCSGDLKSVSLTSQADKCCCDAGGVNQKCCTDKTVYIQYENSDKQISSFRLELGKFQLFINNWYAKDTLVVKQERVAPVVQHRAPPPKKLLWLHHCSLTYYG